jgi:hypothetical protein
VEASIQRVGPDEPAENGEGEADQEDGSEDIEETRHDEGILTVIIRRVNELIF